MLYRFLYAAIVSKDLVGLGAALGETHGLRGRLRRLQTSGRLV